jgi:hypothetical protein
MDQRFMMKIRKNESGCWEWIASKTRKGYGQFRFEGKVKGAHQVSYQLFVGIIPNGLFVLHSCDNPSCVNPKHLSVGTHQENMRQMVERERKNGNGGNGWCFGLDNLNGKLSNDEVIEMRILREFGFTHNELSKMFNISVSHAGNICRSRCRQLNDV